MSDERPVNPIPSEHGRLIPLLVVDSGPAALELYAKAFGARELVRLTQPDSETLLHAELCVGDALFIVHDEVAELHARAPKSLGGASCALWLYVEDVDAAVEQAVAAGCTLLEPAADMFWGDRLGKVADPFGHLWTLASRVKALSPDEIAAAAQQAFGEGAE